VHGPDAREQSHPRYPDAGEVVYDETFLSVRPSLGEETLALLASLLRWEVKLPDSAHLWTASTSASCMTSSLTPWRFKLSTNAVSRELMHYDAPKRTFSWATLGPPAPGRLAHPRPSWLRDPFLPAPFSFPASGIEIP
jgi:hypothetical protein